MIVRRENNNIYSKPIIEQQHIDFIREKYNEGWSQTKIAKEMSISAKKVSEIMHNNNIKIKTNREQALKSYCNENFFENIDTEEKAYWLGFMYADGYIVNKIKHNSYKIGITLNVKDIEHLVKFKKSINSNQNIHTYKSSGGYSSNDYSKIVISSDKLALSLMEKGCLVNKTDILTFPNESILPYKLIRHFIRGYIDGDGCISYSYNKRNKLEIRLKACGTKEILNGFLQYFNLQHLSIYKRHKDRTNNNFQMDIGGNIQTLRILDHLYYDSEIYLNRKYEKYLYIKEQFKK